MNDMHKAALARFQELRYTTNSTDEHIVCEMLTAALSQAQSGGAAFELGYNAALALTAPPLAGTREQDAEIAFERAKTLRGAAASMDTQERRDRRDDEDLSRMADNLRSKADVADEIGKAILALSSPPPQAPQAEGEIADFVRQYRDAWRDCIDRQDGEAAQRENWDGSDHNLAAFDRVMDFAATPPLAAERGSDAAAQQKYLAMCAADDVCDWAELTEKIKDHYRSLVAEQQTEKT